jgi:anti-sigma factor RsiW
MATQHLTEDELILHYYGETAPALEQRAAAHLEACGPCRGEYMRLQHVLGVIDESAVAVEPSPSFERTVWARLEPNLRPAQRSWMSWVMSPAPLGLAAAVVVLVVGAFFAGRALSPAPAPSAAATAAAVEQIRERILLSDLGEHLDRSQMALVELVSVDEDATGDISGERSRAEQLVADSRLYRQTAESTGDVALSELLDEIERVLTEVAASPESGSSRDLADVRRRIESRDLLFKVRVVSSDIRERQKVTNQRQAGPRS